MKLSRDKYRESYMESYTLRGEPRDGMFDNTSKYMIIDDIDSLLIDVRRLLRRGRV